MGAMTIAGLARSADVGVETVRYYQRRGLLQTPDRPDGYGQSGSIRRYDNDDVRRLRFIRSAQAAGFTLEQIGELLALNVTEDRARVRALAEDRLVALGVQIETLKKAQDSLRRLARKCATGAAGPCPILTSFDHAGG